MASAYKQSIMELEQRRLRARDLYDIRIDEVFKKIPQLKEIRQSINLTSASITKALIKGGDTEKLLNDLRENNQVFQEQERYLLSSQGYDENYLRDIYVCNICQDRGFIDNKRCKCFDRLMIDKLYQISNLKDVIEYENFDNFDIKYFSDSDYFDGITPRQLMINNYKVSEMFVEEFDKQYRNILMYGDVGLGKSFLCNCIAKELLDKGYVVIYVSSVEMFKKLEEYKFHRNENTEHEEFISYLTKADLLIIDDLGTEVQTQFTSSELFNIINKRHTDRKHSIISTNMSLGDIENVYSHRLESRFLGNFDSMKFVGKDIRLQKKFS